MTLELIFLFNILIAIYIHDKFSKEKVKNKSNYWLFFFNILFGVFVFCYAMFESFRKNKKALDGFIKLQKKLKRHIEKSGIIEKLNHLITETIEGSEKLFRKHKSEIVRTTAYCLLFIILIYILLPLAYLFGETLNSDSRSETEPEYNPPSYEPSRYCPVCPNPSAWSPCADFKQSRTVYYCDSSTDYHCISTKEEKSCVPEDERKNYISNEYEWEFKGSEYKWSPVFPRDLYDYYKNKSRPLLDDYSLYATDPYDDLMISQLVNVLKNASERNGFNEYETVNFVISFVQSLPYTSDDITTLHDEYPRYPIETLVDNGGDCEDTSILTAVLLNELGYGVVLIGFPKHMAVGVLGDEGIYGTYYEDEGRKYFYLETTGEGWEIGELPDEYKGEKASFRYLVPKPFISVIWQSEGVEAGYFYPTYEINITARNEGTSTAKNLKIWTGFDSTSEGMVYSQIEGKEYDIEAGGELNSIVTLSVPRGVYTRLHIIVSGDNFFPKEQVSDWLKT